MYRVTLTSGGHNVSLRFQIAVKIARVQVNCRYASKLGETAIAAAIEKIQLPGVEHIIAVASGKGGVGKSTVAANLALALKAEGYSVGLLDADIYGPSQSTMMGAAGVRPEVQGDQLQPVMAHGIQCMSMGFVASEKTPAVWRGPMASGALQQLLTQTNWQDLNMLIVDMPPGTGDIQLTLAQRVPLSGAVIVTTPQDIALLDARKGIEMFSKVNIPTLGIIENMSTHVCSECGHEEAIFGSGGGESIAVEYGTRVLAQLPLSLAVRELSDSGNPIVAAEPDSEIALALRAAARTIATSVQNSTPDGPTINVLDD
jgi:ATP-binding protein involved in chromosome partitioning